MIYQASSLLLFFFSRTWSCLFFPTADAAFSFQLFVLHFCFQLFTLRVSVQLCHFKLNCPTFHFAPVGKRGLILFTLGASGQQPPTTLLSAYAGCCYVTITKYIYICLNRVIGLMGRVSSNALGDWGSIPDRVIPKTQKMVLDATLLSTHHYKVRIKGKVEQSRHRSCAFPYSSV